MKKFLKKILLKFFIISVFSLCIIQNIEAKFEFSEVSLPVGVYAGDKYTVVVRQDNTVYCMYSMLQNDFGECNVKKWESIITVAAGYVHTVGLKKDVTVVATGNNNRGQCNVQDWTDIIAVAAGYDYTVGLKSDGTFVATGHNDKGQCDVQDWTDIIAVSAGYDYTVGLKSNGTVVATGNNDK